MENRDASAKKALVTDTVLDAGKLDLGKTYYWAADEQPNHRVPGAPDIGKGEVWSFTVQTGRATVPVPADAAKDALIYTGRLKWKPGKYVEKQKVYFGPDRKSVENGTARWVSPNSPRKTHPGTCGTHSHTCSSNRPHLLLAGR